MHLPLDQGESAADAMVSSGEVGEPIQVIDLAGGRDLLAARAAGTDPGDGEMIPPAIVILMASRFLISFYRLGLTVGRYFARIPSVHTLVGQ
jgi:hypothetical protein